MADSDVSLRIQLADPGGGYAPNGTVAGTVRLSAPSARRCTSLEAGLLFLKAPQGLIGWSDTAQVADDLPFGPGRQAAAVDFQATVPPNPAQTGGQWYVEARATIAGATDDAVDEILVERLPVTLQASAAPAEPGWSAGSILVGLIYVTVFGGAGLFGAALALNVWGIGIPLGVRLFGLALLMGGFFVIIKLAGEFRVVRGLAGALLLGVAALGVYLAFVAPGWAPLRPHNSQPSDGFSLLQIASVYANPVLDRLAGRAQTALTTAYLAVLMAGWVLMQNRAGGTRGATHFPFLLLVVPPPALLAWLGLSHLVGQVLGGADAHTLRVTATLTAILAVGAVYIGWERASQYSRYPLAATLLAALLAVCLVFEVRHTPTIGPATLTLLVGWGLMAVAVLVLGNRLALAERTLGPVAVNITPVRLQLGRLLNVSVEFTPRRAVRLTRVRTKVFASETTVDNPNRPPSERSTSTLIIFQQQTEKRFSEPTPAGRLIRQELKIQLPNSIRHSGKLSWELDVAIEVDGHPDWGTVFPLVVAEA